MSHLTLKQFILRSEVLKLYRSMIRVTYQIKDKEQRKQLQQWIRTDFENNKHHTDEILHWIVTDADPSEVQDLSKILFSEKDLSMQVLDLDQEVEISEARQYFSVEAWAKEVIRMMLSKGKLSLREIEQAVLMAR